MTPKFKNRAERRAWLDTHASSPEYVPAAYEPEPWDVVKDGVVAVVREAAEHELAKYDGDPSVRLVRRPAPGAWEPVVTEPADVHPSGGE